MADDAAAAAGISAAETSTRRTNKNTKNKNNKKNTGSSSSSSNAQRGGNGILVGLAGHTLRGVVGVLKWTGDLIGEPVVVEQGRGRGEAPPGSPSAESGEPDQKAPSAGEGLAMAMAAPYSVDGDKSDKAKVGGDKGGGARAGARGGRPRGRAASALVHGLDSRCFWAVILGLVSSAFVLGFVACHFSHVFLGVPAGRALTGMGTVHQGNRNFRPGDTCQLSISTEQCGLAGLKFDVRLPGEVIEAAQRHAALSERNNNGGTGSSSSGVTEAARRDAAPAKRKWFGRRSKNDSHGGSSSSSSRSDGTEAARRDAVPAKRKWFGRRSKNDSHGGSGSSSSGSGGTEATRRDAAPAKRKWFGRRSKNDSGSGSGSSKTGSGSGSGSGSDAGQGGGGVTSKVLRAFRAFNSWRESHRDEAQELLDGPWV